MSKKKNDDPKSEKALFLQRFVAFLIDVFIVSTLASMLASPFVNTKKIEDLEEKSYKLVSDFSEKKITLNEYTAEYMNITYSLVKNNGMASIIGLLLGIVFYVVIPFYWDGKTIGKKILKIKIVSSEGSLSMNQLIFRAMIVNSMLLDFITILLIMIAPKTTYFYCVGIFSLIQYIIMIVSAFMVMYGKEGLSIHDRLVHTKVVKL